MDEISSSEMKKAYQRLCEIGCCRMCALRYLGETERTAFTEVKATLVNVSIDLISTDFFKQC